MDTPHEFERSMTEVLEARLSGASLSSVPPTVKAVAATQSARLLACVRVQNIFGS